MGNPADRADVDGIPIRCLETLLTSFTAVNTEDGTGNPNLSTLERGIDDSPRRRDHTSPGVHPASLGQELSSSECEGGAEGGGDGERAQSPGMEMNGSVIRASPTACGGEDEKTVADLARDLARSNRRIFVEDTR